MMNCQHHLDDARHAIADVKRGLSEATAGEICVAAIGIVATMGGAIAQLISVNFLVLHGFPSDYETWTVGGPYTVLLLSSLFALICYIFVFIGVAIYAKAIGKFRNPFANMPMKAYAMMTLAGIINVCNGCAMIFSVPHLQLVLQAILLSAALPFTIIAARLAHVNTASYLHPVAIASVVFAVLGVGVGTAAVESGSDSVDNTANQGFWVVFYMFGVICMALISVVAARFMMNYAKPHEHEQHYLPTQSVLEDDESAELRSVDLSPLLYRDSGVCAVQRREFSDGNGSSFEPLPQSTALLVYVFFGTFMQAVAAVAAMPLDFTPMIGVNSGNATASTNAIRYGLDCVFNNLPGVDSCGRAGAYFFVFVIAFAANKAGTVVLASAISAPVSTLINLLVSPIGALIVAGIPALNPNGGGGTNIGLVVLSTLLLIFASCMFSFFEQMVSVRLHDATARRHAAH